MYKIMLIGDSIRMGYDKFVKTALDGVAEVFYPDENCRFAEYVLRYAHEWKKQLKTGDDVDLVHWNAGLWDALELFGDEPLSTTDYYENAIRRIYSRLKLLFPKAKQIFALSTPVQEEKMSATFHRHNSTIRQYNEIAVKALKDTDIVINDLYSVADALPESAHSDAVHYYTDLGTEFIGGAVLSVICSQLGISAKSVNLADFSPERYSPDKIGF